MEQSETSDNRPYQTTVNISSFNTQLVQENVDIENAIHHQPTTSQNYDDDESVNHHQPTTPQQLSQITQDTTESLQDTLMNTLNTSTITDSNALQVPIHDITENTNNLFNQEDPFTLSTINTIDTQPLQTHRRQNYDPPPPPSENSSHTTPQHSPQQGSSNTFHMKHTLTGSQSQTTTPPRQSTQMIQFIPAQPSISQNTNNVLTINTLHTNLITNASTSRTLSRPLLPLIQNNPLSYNLTSTNFHSQSSSNASQYTNIQSFSTQFSTHIPSTTIQTSLHGQPISIQPQINTLNLPPTSFNSHTTHAIPSSTTPLTTLNTPTTLQHIEARVTFSIGLNLLLLRNINFGTLAACLLYKVH